MVEVRYTVNGRTTMLVLRKSLLELDCVNSDQRRCNLPMLQKCDMMLFCNTVIGRWLED